MIVKVCLTIRVMVFNSYLNHNFKSAYGTPVDKPMMDVREFVVCYIQMVRLAPAVHILARPSKGELHSFLNHPLFRHSSYLLVIMSTVYTLIIRNHLIISQTLHTLPIPIHPTQLIRRNPHQKQTNQYQSNVVKVEIKSQKY